MLELVLRTKRKKLIPDLFRNMNEAAISVVSFVNRSVRFHFDGAVIEAVIVDLVSSVFKASLIRLHLCLMLLRTQWYLIEERGPSRRVVDISRIRV
jgi:hypothetical protein